ncbi:MAG TPA: helix-turn-helix domain-containing protein [Kofleriaceae bacterium]|jgi:transcriptional regulator with XRE-family HTH domain|nr:helix-turn-helix domain-containing protein [Kofleriaceae bacterium]
MMKEKKKKKVAKPRASGGPKCECGGTFKPVTLRSFDFSRYAGLPSFLDGAPGWRCDACQREMLHGQVINASLFFIAMTIVGLPHRLTAEFARYLRRSMQITQQELADRMGIARETVASWESGLKEISPQHDLILRVLVSNHARGSEALPTKVAVDIANEVVATLSSVRSEPAPRKPPDLRVTESDFKKLPPALLNRMQHAVPTAFAS